MAKGDLIAGCNVPEAAWSLLKAMGMPEHVKSFKIECKDANSLIEVECTFYPTLPDGNLIVKDDRFVTESKKYHLVEVEPPAREIPQPERCGSCGAGFGMHGLNCPVPFNGP